MAFVVLTTTLVTIAGNNLAAYCAKAELGMECEDKDVTVFTSLGWKQRLGGLKDGSLSILWKQDLAAAALDAILWPLFGTVPTFSLKATSAAVGTSNPLYSGSLLINSHKPIAGDVGAVNEFDVDWPTSGEIVRTTA